VAGAFALVGLVVGGIYVLVRPPEYHATSLVLLPTRSSTTSSGTSSANSLTTDGRIATSASVLVPAGRAVDRSLSVSQLQGRVTTGSAATGVLSITASGPTADDAVALANAVATRLVSFVTSSGSAADTGVLTSLQAQENELTTQLGNVNKELAAANTRLAAAGANTTEGHEDSALVAKLTSEQSNLTLQLNSVKAQIATVRLGQVSANQGTKVIQHATGAVGPKVSTLALTVILGGLIGSLVGCVYVLARHRRDPRLWTRDELADALASPVVLSLAVPAKESPSSWTSLLQTHQPGSSEQWNIRKTLRELGLTEGPASLVVVSFADDIAATALGVEVAAGAADAGLRTLFTVVADEEGAAGLQAACVQFGTDRPRQNLQVRVGIPPQRKVMPDLTVTAAVVDPARPTLPELFRPGGVVVLAVSAGQASAEELARVAILTADRGHPVRGLFVANPGNDDQTVGRFPGGRTQTSLVRHQPALATKAGVASGRSR
jgi:capsular polysaccharide biosynthesis protein